MQVNVLLKNTDIADSIETLLVTSIFNSVFSITLR